MTGAGPSLDRRSRAKSPCVDLKAQDDDLARSRAEWKAAASRHRTEVFAACNGMAACTAEDATTLAH